MQSESPKFNQAVACNISTLIPVAVHSQDELLSILELLGDFDLAAVDDEETLGGGALFDDDLSLGVVLLFGDLGDLLEIVLAHIGKKRDAFQFIDGRRLHAVQIIRPRRSEHQGENPPL